MLAIKLFISHLIWMKLIFCFSIDWIETEIINFFFKAQAADQLKSTASAKSVNKRSSSKVKEAWLYRLSLHENIMPSYAKFCKFLLDLSFQTSADSILPLQSKLFQEAPNPEHITNPSTSAASLGRYNIEVEIYFLSSFLQKKKLTALSTNQI